MPAFTVPVVMIVTMMAFAMPVVMIITVVAGLTVPRGRLVPEKQLVKPVPADPVVMTERRVVIPVAERAVAP